ncbi:MAG: DUF4391 domain-containing protein [Lentisphaeria bacterium]
MLEKRFEFPKTAELGRIIPKKEIISRAGGGLALQKLFRLQVERVRCAYEITSGNVNLKSSLAVPKILIIQIQANVEMVDMKILQAMDKAFHVPLIFEIHEDKSLYYTACYRRRSDADSPRWVLGEYFTSAILASDSESEKMPQALSIEALYEKLIMKLCPLRPVANEDIRDFVNRAENLQKLEQKRGKLEKRIRKEKQFNRQVELNTELNTLKSEINVIKDL